MNKWIKRALFICLTGFVLLNVMAYFHAYKFTHYARDIGTKTTQPEDISFGEKLKTLFFGVKNPRPKNDIQPTQPFTTHSISSNKKLEVWLMTNKKAKGTVLLFPGYGGSKSQLINKSKAFHEMGFTTVLVDFMGCGGSEGNQTTLGYKESKNVTSVYNWVRSKNQKPIYLMGSSLGASAILKAVSESNIRPNGIIIECPFSSLYQTTCARFDLLNVPSFPMAGILLFWGSIQNGFWAFNHKPVEFAKDVNCSVLYFIGDKDPKVSLPETKTIYKNLKGNKKLVVLTDAGHEDYLKSHPLKWKSETLKFLTQQHEPE